MFSPFAKWATILIMFLMLTGSAPAQRIEAEVETDLRTLPQERQEKLTDFADKVRHYLNNSPWCEDEWDYPVYIQATIRLQDMTSGAEERYQGTLVISNSYDIQFSDIRWRFAYQSGDMISYDENDVDSFTSFLNFYVYMILGGEFDKWSTLGGTQYYEKARNIAEQAKFGLGRFIEGWDRRQELVNYFLSEQHKPFREMVDYYFYGLSFVQQDNAKARKHIATAIDKLDRLIANDPDNEYAQDFLKAHYQEIVEVYRRALNKQPLRTMMILDPDHERIYRDILER